MGLLASLPGEKLAEALYSGSTSFGPALLAKTVRESFGYWSRILEFYRTKNLADELMDHYSRYPGRPEAVAVWQSERDRLMEQIYEVTGADAKY
jgi:hypothetical protein